MSLTIRNISFDNFRNYHQLRLGELNRLTIFVGRNAVGKTNIIEGIQLLTAHHSFRHPTTAQLTGSDAETFRIAMHLSDDARELDVSMAADGGRRKYQLNGKSKKTADLRELAPSVTFTPDDLDLVKGSQTRRRGELDALAAQLSANYHVIRRDYENVVRHKNALLKDEADQLLIDVINEQLIQAGAQMAWYRAGLIAKMAPMLGAIYKEITQSDETLDLCYVPSWEEHDPEEAKTFEFDRDTARLRLAGAIERRALEERARHKSCVGPHADKLEFFINGKNATTYGSQGQQRSVVLAWKLAEVALIREMLGQQPILLLDDVMSELDEYRRQALMDLVTDSVQTFITTTNLSYFSDDALRNANIIHLPLEEGCFT